MRRAQRGTHELAVALAAGLALVCVFTTACDGEADDAAPSSTPSDRSPTSPASPGEVQWTIDPELPRKYRGICRGLHRRNEIEIPLDRSRQHVTNRTFSGRHTCANFYSSEIQDVAFRNLDAEQALFRRALLRRVTFTHSRLHMSDFWGATLRDVEFRSVNLFGADFLHVNLRNVRFVDVVCPSGINSDDNGGSCSNFGIPTGPTMPCDPSFGFPEPRAGCPDPHPVTGWLSHDDQGRLVLHPFRSYANDAQGRAYAESHGLEFPFPNDTYDAPAGPPQFIALLQDTVCTGIIVVDFRSPLEDHVVDCAKLKTPRRPFAAAVWRDGTTVVQVSELYRP